MVALRVKEPTADGQGDVVYIDVNGTSMKGFTSEPISVTLYANGVKFFDVSKKLYRPRGFFSLHPQARTATVNVNGIPATNPSEVYLEEGLKVRIQQKRPFLMRFFERMIDTSLLHKSVVKNKLIWPLVLKFIANNINNPKPATYETPHVSMNVERADLVVVGGGVAGLSAAIEARRHGLEVLQIDDGIELGGEMLSDGLEPPGISEPGYVFVKNLRKKALELGVRVLLKTTFVGFFEDAALAFSSHQLGSGTPHIISAKAYVIATGAVDLPCIFVNNDLPGIIDASSAMRMLSIYGVVPGRNVVIVGATERGLRLAEHLKKHRVNVILLDKSKGSANKGDDVIYGVKEIIAVGKGKVEALKIKCDDEELKLTVDCIICAASMSPDIKISAQAGAKVAYIKELGFVPIHDLFMRTSKDGIFVAGGASGSPYGILHVIEGKIAGLSAAISLGKAVAETERDELVKEYKSLLQKFGISDHKKKIFRSFETNVILDEKVTEVPTLFCLEPRRDAFVCFCEDIRLWDLYRSVSTYGFTCLEKVKRSTGIGTGRCQGRLCLVNSALYIAYVADLSPNAVGMAKQRPPAISIPINVLTAVDVKKT